jgi:BlaI family transcriptional regulator, penicillinase repressor
MMKYEKITESEWQVMRILWDHSPQTSAQIIQQMTPIQKWSPTTIKTFISRLIDKNVLSYEKIGDKRSYFPLITEKDCVLNEMKSTINMIYGGKENYSTKNFVFYGDNDEAFIKQLAPAIEVNYASLSNHFSFQFKDKQSIYLHSSQSRLFSALGMNQAPSWVRAASMWDILHLAPKESFTDRDPNRLLHHVLTTLVIQTINPSAPYWLQQGISAYESQWLSLPDIKKSILTSQYMLDQLDFVGLSDQFLQFREYNGHEFAYTFVECIIKTFGYPKLNAFIQDPNELSRQFNQESHSLREIWRSFLDKEYLGGVCNDK